MDDKQYNRIQIISNCRNNSSKYRFLGNFAKSGEFENLTEDDITSIIIHLDKIIDAVFSGAAVCNQARVGKMRRVLKLSLYFTTENS